MLVELNHLSARKIKSNLSLKRLETWVIPYLISSSAKASESSFPLKHLNQIETPCFPTHIVIIKTVKLSLENIWSKTICTRLSLCFNL